MSTALNGSYGFHNVTVKLFDVTEVKAGPIREACLVPVWLLRGVSRIFENFLANESFSQLIN